MGRKKMPPIPLCALPHKVSLKHKTLDGIYNEIDNTEVLITHVRVELYERISGVSSTDFSVRSRSAVMYYDIVNSSPKGLSFEIGQIVNYEGKNYAVTSVNAVMAEEIIHHYRIELL
jgi:uncharacterized protein YjaZ